MYLVPSAGKRVPGAKRGKTCNWYQARENMQVVPSAGKGAIKSAYSDWSAKKSRLLDCFNFEAVAANADVKRTLIILFFNLLLNPGSSHISWKSISED